MMIQQLVSHDPHADRRMAAVATRTQMNAARIQCLERAARAATAEEAATWASQAAEWARAINRAWRASHKSSGREVAA